MRTLGNIKTVANVLAAVGREALDGFNNGVEYASDNSKIVEAASQSNFVDTIKGDAEVNEVLHESLVDLFKASEEEEKRKKEAAHRRATRGY